MASLLAAILPPEQLYDYRSEPYIELAAPYQQGDVFRMSYSLFPGPNGDAKLAMLFMHPCTMRRAGALEEFVTVVPVKQESPRRVLLRPETWQGNYKVMPLPDLVADGRSTHSADFMHITTISSADLPRTARIAQLSTLGRLQMQQRLINHFTRYVVGMDVLAEATAHIEAEALYQADWVTAAARAGRCDADSEHDVEQAEKEYQEYLDADREGEDSLRLQLKAVEQRSRATRLIQIEISERYPRPS